MRKMTAISEEIFSAIPMPTWRWLGVNEAKVPAGVNGKETKIKKITLLAGEKRTVSRKETAGSKELHIILEPWADLTLEQAVLLDAGKSSATKVKVTVK